MSRKGGEKILKGSLILGLALVLIAGMSLGYFVRPSAPSADHLKALKDQDVSGQRGAWEALADSIRGELAKEGKYDCCLVSPCSYCIEEEECTCRQDILNGEHPCGECIGEILEGKGLPDLKPYYAKAIAHKVGAKHEAHLQAIIDDMYPNKE